MAASAARQPTGDDFNEMATTADGGGRVVSTVVHIEEFIVRTLHRAEASPPVVAPITKWLQTWSSKPQGQGAKCACCDDGEFQFDFPSGDPMQVPQKYFLAYADGVKASETKQTIVSISGVCPACIEKMSDIEILTVSARKLAGDDSGMRIEGPFVVEGEL